MAWDKQAGSGLPALSGLRDLLRLLFMVTRWWGSKRVQAPGKRPERTSTRAQDRESPGKNRRRQR